MSDKKNRISQLFKSYLPQNRSATIGLVIFIAVAFTLGAIFFGGSPEVATHAEHGSEASKSEPTVWTCSMHPQIKLPKMGKCPICFMDLIPLETNDGDDQLGPRQLRMSDAARQLARIDATEAQRGFGEAEIRMVGRLAYDETRMAVITAWVSGRLDRLYADYTGMTVSRGDHLVEIYSPELLAAQEELIQAGQVLKTLQGHNTGVLASTAEATITSAREKLNLLGLTKDQIEAIENSKERSNQIIISAPIGGVVVNKNATEGMYVKTGTPIYTIADLTKLWVTLEAYESDLPWLRYGQEVLFTSPSFPGEQFTALISFIDPVVDRRTRTVRVRAIVDNSDMRLKPDMFVKAIVKSRLDHEGMVLADNLYGKWISPMHPEVVKDGPGQCDVCGMDLVPAKSLGYASRAESDTEAPILIPITAPLITGTRAVVYIMTATDDGPLFEGREVELGPRAGQFYIIKSGIAEGELVVTNGAFKLDSELQIRAKPSMMSPPDNDEARMYDLIVETDKVIEALTPIYNSYFDLQIALADDDLDRSKASFAEINKAIKAIPSSIFSSVGLRRWLDLSEVMLPQGVRGGDSPDFVEARDAFYYLSQAVINLHESFGHAENLEYYLTFCPMARDNDGAFWLQNEKLISNSFYGSMMLRCGETKAELPPSSEEGN